MAATTEAHKLLRSVALGNLSPELLPAAISAARTAGEVGATEGLGGMEQGFRVLGLGWAHRGSRGQGSGGQGGKVLGEARAQRV